jgi:hypothetical protein
MGPPPVASESNPARDVGTLSTPGGQLGHLQRLNCLQYSLLIGRQARNDTLEKDQHTDWENVMNLADGVLTWAMKLCSG